MPIHRYLPAFWFFRNTDIWDKEIGADVVPKDADDFKKILQQLNRPQENRWAIGNFGPNNATMYGIVSFSWRCSVRPTCGRRTRLEN